MIKQTADTLLNEPVKFSVHTGWPIWKKVKFQIRPLYLGTLIKISVLQEQVKFDLKEFEKNHLGTTWVAIRENTEILAKIVAYGILNDRLKIKLFSGILTKFLLWKLDPDSLLKLVGLIVDRLGVTNFISSIISLHGVNVLAPREMSLQNGTGEIIASGVESVE